jgi:hypothetical protein
MSSLGIPLFLYNITIFTKNPTFIYSYCKDIIALGV